jgi:hypothetical protein
MIVIVPTPIFFVSRDPRRPYGIVIEGRGDG